MRAKLIPHLYLIALFVCLAIFLAIGRDNPRQWEFLIYLPILGILAAGLVLMVGAWIEQKLGKKRRPF